MRPIRSLIRDSPAALTFRSPTACSQRLLDIINLDLFKSCKYRNASVIQAGTYVLETHCFELSRKFQKIFLSLPLYHG